MRAGVALSGKAAIRGALSAAFDACRWAYKLTGLRRISAVNAFLRRTVDIAIEGAARRRGLALDPPSRTSLTSKLRFILGTLDRESIAVCRLVVRKGVTALDIGAHAGYYTRMLSDLVGPGGRVFAFEPHPDNFKMLITNVAGRVNVLPVPAAVGARTGKAELYEMQSSSQHSLYDLSRHLPHFERRGSLVVEVTTVDDFLRAYGNPAVGFAKLDVEGAEPAVLVGMEQTIARSPDLVMIVEFNPPALVAVGVGPEGFLEQLHDLGFEVAAILSGGRLVPVQQLTYPPFPTGAGHVNLLCRKREAG